MDQEIKAPGARVPPGFPARMVPGCSRISVAVPGQRHQGGVFPKIVCPNWCYSQTFALLWENVIKSRGAFFGLVIYEPPAEAATFETNWKSLYTNSAI